MNFVCFKTTNRSFVSTQIEAAPSKLKPQKKTLYPTEKETERVQSLREEFWQTVQGFLLKISIDESGVNLSLVRLFARP